METKKRERFEYTIELPEGVRARYEHAVLTINGPQGEVARRLLSKLVTIRIKDSQITLTSDRPTKRDKKMINTFRAHIKNMIRGATEGHTYTLNIASTHFPMNVTAQGQVLTVKNYVGEKKPRSLTAPEGVSVKVSGSTIEVTSTSIEKAGNFAGRLEKLTQRPKFDDRIFQDGIYITKKDTRQV